MPDHGANEHTVLAEDGGQRLDRYLRKLLPNAPLSLLHRWLRQGAVRADGGKASPAMRVEPGMRIALPGEAKGLQRAADLAAAPAARAVHVLWQDAHLLLVDKPRGMATQPGSGVGRDNLVDWLRAQPFSAAGGARTFRPAPAHRLDRGASGVVAIGLSAAGLRGLTRAFRERRVEKSYLALVHGSVRAERGEITLALERVAAKSRYEPKARATGQGKAARTELQVVERRPASTLLRLRIDTGRLHQIRAHLAALGHPIAGDARYGSRMRVESGFLLHAERLACVHPVTGGWVEVEAPVPGDFGTGEGKGERKAAKPHPPGGDPSHPGGSMHCHRRGSR